MKLRDRNTPFRNPGAREAAWGRYYARKGAAVVVMRHTRVPSPNDRRAAWLAKYDRLPPELQAKRVVRFDFRPAREPADPDNYMLRSA